MNYWLSQKEIERLYENKQPYRRKCKCGHTVYVLSPTGRKVCSHCHSLVFINKEEEFKYRLKEKLIKEKRRRNER